MAPPCLLLHVAHGIRARTMGSEIVSLTLGEGHTGVSVVYFNI